MQSMLNKWILAIGLLFGPLVMAGPAEDKGVVSAQSDVEYHLGVGDVIHINVYENPDLTTVARVSETGKFRFPLIGEITVGGKTASAVELLIAKQLRDGGFVREPQVRVIVEQFRSQRVAVIGHVHRPGNYPINDVSSVLELLAEAGGVTERGADHIKLIKRVKEGSKSVEINLVEALRKGILSNDITVSDGDIIYVPPMDVFYIYGEVQRPGVYRIEPNMSVMQALALGGGLTARGTERGISVRRQSDSGKMTAANVNMDDNIQPNDVIYIKESLF